MKKIMAFTVAMTLIWPGILPLRSLADEMPSRSLSEGKTLFEERCSRCHEIDRPLARDMERSEWEKLLIEMASRGADMQEGEKELILDYLSARHVFTSKCTGCHTRERIFDRERAYKEWVATVQAMADKNPDLLSEQEAAAIVSYLALVLGPQP
jgi:mono/diheme cytochrome c family protein